MTYRANPVLEKLDRAAELTGMPAFARASRRNVALPFRFAPLIILLFAVVGLVLQTRVPLSGWTLLMTLWMSSMPLGLSGPMRLPAGGAYDERERALIRAGHFAGLLAVAVLAIGGCFLAGIVSALAMLRLVAPPWMPGGVMDWVALGFFLLVVELNVAVLFVSWSMPRVAPLDDEA